eukprot:gene11551-13484_t
MTSNDVSYFLTSIAYTFGLRNSIASIIAGCQIVLFGNGEIRDDILQAPSPTMVFGGLIIYQWLMDRGDHSLVLKMRGPRYAFSTGAVLPVELRRSIYERYGFHIRQNYGTTETGMISLDIYPNIEKYSSNRFYEAPYYEYKTVEHPFGGLEICVRSDVCLANGYITSGMTLQPIVDDEGWYHTGDMVEMVQDLDSPNNQVMSFVHRIRIARNTLIGDLDLYKIEQSVLAGLQHQIYKSIAVTPCVTASEPRKGKIVQDSNNEGYNPLLVDVWAIGAVSFRLLTGRELINEIFPTLNQSTVLAALVNLAKMVDSNEFQQGLDIIPHKYVYHTTRSHPTSPTFERLAPKFYRWNPGSFHFFRCPSGGVSLMFGNRISKVF